MVNPVTCPVVIQTTDVKFPAMNPVWAATLIAAILIIGFPFALIFARVFEVTPEGIKQEH